MYFIFRQYFSLALVLSAFASGIFPVAVRADQPMRMSTNLPETYSAVLLQFEDACAKPISYSNHDYAQSGRRSPISLSAKISGLEPGKRVWVEVEVNLVSNKPNNQQPLKFNQEYTASANGEVALKYPVRLAKSGYVDLWIGRISWTQPGFVKNSGGFHSALMLFNHREAAKKFYRVVSTPLCQWESSVAIASEYYWNGGAAPLMVNRSEQFSADNLARQGYDLGLQFMSNTPEKQLKYSERDFGNKYRDMNRLPKLPGIPQSGPLVWFFSGWQNVIELKQDFTMDRLWSLKPGEGAFHGQRTTFTRYEAVEFAEVENNGCQELQQTRAGWIDIGLSATNLYAVPSDLSGSPEQARAFMEMLQPAINTCKDSQYPIGAPEFKVTGARDSLLFFYPGKNQNE